MGTIVSSLDFQAIHDLYRPKVLRYLTRLVGQSEAEDLTQAVMLKVSSSVADFRGDSRLSTWIYRIASNTAMDSLRRNATRLPIDPGTDAQEGADAVALQVASLEDTLIREEMSACVREFIERLPETYKTVVLLSELEGFKNDEIATLLGLTVGTVKIRLHRARERLRRELDEGCSLEHNEAGELGCDRKQIATATITFRKGT